MLLLVLFYFLNHQDIGLGAVFSRTRSDSRGGSFHPPHLHGWITKPKAEGLVCPFGDFCFISLQALLRKNLHTFPGPDFLQKVPMICKHLLWGFPPFHALVLHRLSLKQNTSDIFLWHLQRNPALASPLCLKIYRHLYLFKKSLSSKSPGV